MFRTTITESPLVSQTASSFFTNITGEYVLGDCSFLATLRALVAPRIGSDESLRLSFSTSRYTSTNISGSSTRQVMNAIVGQGIRTGKSGEFAIHSFNAEDEANVAAMRVVESEFAKVCSGYHQLEKMTAFFRKSFPVLCYINPERKNVVIFVEKINLKKLHYLQCAILAALPWYFNPEEGVSELEMELLQSLRENTEEKYVNCIAKIASTYDFRTAQIKQLLEGFESKYQRVECRSISGAIRSCISDIESLERSGKLRQGSTTRRLQARLRAA